MESKFVAGEELVYSEVMEDWDVVARALALGAEDTVVSVASAGDNVWHAALDGARQVHAVDLNPAQIRFCRLKEAAARELGWEGFAELMGVESPPQRSSAARKRELLACLPAELVAGGLPSEAAQSAAVEHGLVQAGRLAAFVAPLRDAVLAVVGRDAMEAIANEPDRARREQMWRERFEPSPLRALLAEALSQRTISDTFIPASAFASMAEPSFGAFYYGVLRRLLVELEPRANYFLHRLWLGRFPASGALPSYLARSSHARLRARLDAVTWHEADLRDFLRGLRSVSVQAFNLSNVLDWSDDEHHRALWIEVDRVAASGARCFLRSFLRERAAPAEIAARWTLDRELSEPMPRADRVGYFARCETWIKR